MCTIQMDMKNRSNSDSSMSKPSQGQFLRRNDQLSESSQKKDKLIRNNARVQHEESAGINNINADKSYPKKIFQGKNKRKKKKKMGSGEIWQQQKSIPVLPGIVTWMSCNIGGQGDDDESKVKAYLLTHGDPHFGQVQPR